MYLVATKTMLVQGMRQTFDAGFPTADFRDTKVSMEFPVSKTDYPSVWVDWEPSGRIQKVGIGHREYDDAPAGLTRWRFSGTATFTAVALTSLERDRLADAVIRVLAFGPDESSNVGAFRTYLEENDLIAANANFDEIDQRGTVAAPGTPWGTDEVIYETTFGLTVVGEFVSETSGVLAVLSDVVTIPYEEGTEDPTDDVGWQ